MTRRGRPGIGPNGAPGVRLQIVLPPEVMERLDTWRTWGELEVTRAEAARTIIERTLKNLLRR